jgi:hypothetical protein
MKSTLRYLYKVVLNLAVNYEEPFLQEAEEDQRVIFMGEILSREEEGEGGASNMEQALNLTLGSGSFLEKFCFVNFVHHLFLREFACFLKNFYFSCSYLC